VKDALRSKRQDSNLNDRNATAIGSYALLLLARTLACGYLDDPSTSIGEVAYLVGFSDTSNFTSACT